MAVSCQTCPFHKEKPFRCVLTEIPIAPDTCCTLHPDLDLVSSYKGGRNENLFCRTAVYCSGDLVE